VTAPACLELFGLRKVFGGLVAVNDVTFAVEAGTITGLIGPNGSGKTVIFDCITGFYRPDGGRVVFLGRDITGRRPYEVCVAGIGRSFQTTGSFGALSVRENLAFAAQPKTILASVSAVPLGEPRTSDDRTEEILHYTGLDQVRDEIVSNLPHGQQKMVEFASLMMMNPAPRMYMLDEPFAGLNTAEISSYTAAMEEMRQAGKTFLIVEHNMRVIMKLCHRIVALDHGEKIAEGSPTDIAGNARVVEAYLGSRATS
jgi:branched-chain amino acid transport system ATP-binding protein